MRPQAVEPNQECTVQRGEPRPPVPLVLKDCQLVAEGQILKLESSKGPRPKSYDQEQKK